MLRTQERIESYTDNELKAIRARLDTQQKKLLRRTASDAERIAGVTLSMLVLVSAGESVRENIHPDDLASYFRLNRELDQLYRFGILRDRMNLEIERRQLVGVMR